MKQFDLFLQQMKEQAVNYYTEVAETYKRESREAIAKSQDEWKLTDEEQKAEIINPETPYEYRSRYDKAQRCWYQAPQYFKTRSQQMHHEARTKMENATNQRIATEIRHTRLENFKIWIEKQMQKDLEKKKANLIKRIEKKGGKIIDAIELHYGVDSGINGLVNCENKVVKIETIYAGGYNIQCLHYRVLVK